MKNDLMQQWTELNKNAMDSVKALGEINTNAMTRLTQRQMEIVNIYMEGGAKQLEALSEAEGIQDLATAQSRLFTELNEKLLENTRKTMEVLADVKSELSAWAEKGMEQTTQKTASSPSKSK